MNARQIIEHCEGCVYLNCWGEIYAVLAVSPKKEVENRELETLCGGGMLVSEIHEAVSKTKPCHKRTRLN